MLAILEPFIFSLCRMVSKNTFPEQQSLLNKFSGIPKKISFIILNHNAFIFFPVAG
jgi:hypothetical protein